MIESDIIGAIKIKDGLFIGDKYAARVQFSKLFDIKRILIENQIKGFRICIYKQSDTHNKLCRARA